MTRIPNSTPPRSMFWLLIAGLSLVGVVVFSVAAALEPDVRAYEIGQIAAAVVLLASVLYAHAVRRNGGHSSQ